MSSPYVGEIRMFGGSFAPAGWSFCDGQLLPISQNETLFNLIGTTYGGDGQETFALPNLQSRVPMHAGTNPQNGTTYQLAETGGSESVTLTIQQIPTHNHAFMANSNAGTQPQPQGAVMAKAATGFLYTGFDPGSQMPANTVNPTGGSQPHENMLPFLVISFIISLFGIFPSQN